MIRPSFGPSFGPSINFLFLSFSIVQCNTTGYCIARSTSIQSFILQLDPRLSEAVCLLTKLAIPVTESLSIFRVYLPCLSLQSTLRLTS
ncbi:hypothetical protein BD560DRAFT_416485 [Blakeslea trispora]|nr:hypothetical protein BD560DRAFT_416485 [Blakeslea trispora]